MLVNSAGHSVALQMTCSLPRSPSNREFVKNDLGHYLFQKTDCAIRRKDGHRVIVSCFAQ